MLYMTPRCAWTISTSCSFVRLRLPEGGVEAVVLHHTGPEREIGAHDAEHAIELELRVAEGGLECCAEAARNVEPDADVAGGAQVCRCAEQSQAAGGLQGSVV